MPWTGWVCITVLITYCFSQDTSQYNQKIFHRNPTLTSNLQQFPADLGSDINNAISIQLMNAMNQRQLTSQFRHNAQFQPNYRQNTQLRPIYGQSAQLRPIYRQNAQFQQIHGQNAQFQPNRRQNVQFLPNRRQMRQYQWTNSNSQSGAGNMDRYSQSQTLNRGSSRMEQMEEEEEDEDETTWKDYFENSIDWLTCERWANGITFFKTLVADDVFREWAISQLCQDAMFAFLVPPMVGLLGFDYEAWKF